jgi:quinolinate synthase
MRPISLRGDRDWKIFIECRANDVVLYPSGLHFRLNELAGPDNLLAQAVTKMIDRRQGLVRPGETPFRPQVHFLVRPEHLRTYHQAYPALEALDLPISQHRLQPEDDVRAIITAP